MLTKKLKKLLKFVAKCIAIAIALLLIALSVQSCGCNYYLKKAKKKCGWTNKTDTVYISVPVKVEGQKKDTSFAANQKYERLSAVLDSLFGINTSLKKQSQSAQSKADSALRMLDAKTKDNLKKFIIGAALKNKCIEDTLYIPLAHKGFIKIWMQGDSIRHFVNEPDYFIQTKVPVQVNKTEIKGSGLLQIIKWSALLALILLFMFLAYLYFYKVKH
jgi:hypothetical protein